MHYINGPGINQRSVIAIYINGPGINQRSVIAFGITQGRRALDLVSNADFNNPEMNDYVS